MKVTKLSPRALLIEFPTKKEMNLTCFRLSEFSEGDDRLKQYYTPDVFIDIWSTKKGNIKYFSYWDGHNIPLDKITAFAEVFNGNVSAREQSIIDAGKDIDPDGYIIFSEQGDEVTIKHEKAHLYYREYPEYFKRANQISDKIGANNIISMNQGLLKEGYVESNLQNERQAYLTAFDQEEFDRMFPKCGDVSAVVAELNDLYNEYDRPI